MNTKQLGLLGELKAQYDFIKAGWEISIPSGDYCSYDLLAIKNNQILKIQVKTTEKIQDGVIIFSVNSRNYYSNKTYTEADCDYFYLYCLENETGYLYPTAHFHSSHIRIRVTPPKNNIQKTINFANDYYFSKMINTLD